MNAVTLILITSYDIRTVLKEQLGTICVTSCYST